jgi:hypothetical protein
VKLGAVAAALLALALAGCAGGDERTDGKTSTGSSPPAAGPASAGRDPGRTLGAFVAAASEAKPAAMWALLARPSRARLGPELSEFRARAAKLERTAGRAGGDGSELILAERISERWAVAAVARARPHGYAVYAAALRLEDGRWRVEVADPLRIRAIRPDPDERLPGTRTQVAAEFRARDAITEAGLWLDGLAVPTQAGGLSARYFTAYGESGRLEPGRHSVVAFAGTPRHAGALAWTFVIRASGDA